LFQPLRHEIEFEADKVKRKKDIPERKCLFSKTISSIVSEASLRTFHVGTCTGIYLDFFARFDEERDANFSTGFQRCRL
jgi:hypothetical protein